MFISKINQQQVLRNNSVSPNSQMSAVMFEGIKPNQMRKGAKVASGILLPAATFSAVSVRKDKVSSNSIIKPMDFNSLLMYEMADMVMMSSPAVYYNYEKGKLIKDENGRFSLDNPTNIAFIENYNEAIEATYRSLPDEDLENCVDNLKKLLKNRVSENVYTIASEIYDVPEDFSSYLRYSLSNIVDFDSLAPLQAKMLSVIFEEMIIDELNFENRIPSKYYQSETKLNIMPYKYLLNELNFRHGNLPSTSEVKTNNVEKIVEAKEEQSIGDIKVSKGLSDIFDKAEQDYAREIESYRNAVSQRIDVLSDAYLQYKFSSVANNYFDLRNFNSDMAKRDLPLETEDKKIKYIVERILSKVDSPYFELSQNYKSWKRDYRPKNPEVIVYDVIDKYGKSLMAKICTEETLKELQEANPANSLEMQDLENIVYERFDL